jgi:energy-coupling factor transport system ATP-binding protein
MGKTPIIEFDNFSFKYFAQSRPTLRNINLRIYPGEKILIVGPSGSGKSTMGNCLNGLIPFSYNGEIEGSLTINGTVAKDAGIFELSKIIGTVMQDSDAQFVGLSVAEDIAFSMENDCVPQENMISRVNDVAGLVGVQKLLRQSPHELSGGQKQRTSLAGILVDDVEILLFDEPLANLDPETGKYAIELIDRIHHEKRISDDDSDADNKKKTTIIIEHRIEDVLHREVDRIILIDGGRIVADLNAHEMLSSGHLLEHGLREPLYITALKYAGVNITAGMKPGYFSTIDFSDVRNHVLHWYESVPVKTHAESENEVLRISNLDFEYFRGQPVLRNINMSVKEGEMLSIVGTNGAGKSTLAKLICRFENHSPETVYFNGEDVFDQSISERASFVGYVMQNPNQMITQTQIYDEIASGLRLRKVPSDEIEERVDRVLDICGLSRFKKWPISALSYGQKKRVTIASILILDPRVLILDEPTAGQDYRHYTDIMQFLERINSLGVTIIMITHDMHLMLEYTRRSVVVHDGMIVRDTDSSEVLTDPEIISMASLKETSLFHLANEVGIENPKNFVDRFLDYEAGLKNESI